MYWVGDLNRMTSQFRRGGGGFLMFYTRRPQDLKREMAALKIKEVPFTFDYEGTKIL